MQKEISRLRAALERMKACFESGEVSLPSLVHDLICEALAGSPAEPKRHHARCKAVMYPGSPHCDCGAVKGYVHPPEVTAPETKVKHDRNCEVIAEGGGAPCTCGAETGTSLDEAVASRDNVIEQLEHALVYACFALHGTPMRQLPAGIRLIDNDQVEVLVKGLWIHAGPVAMPSTETE